MSANVIYTGIFFDKKNQEQLFAKFPPKLFRAIGEPHVTLSFKPDKAASHSDLWGTKATVTVIGYGKNEDNEGVLVKVQTENEQLQASFDEIKVPHITLSVSENGKPVNTAYLNFKPCEEICIEGVFGAFVKSN